MLTHTHDWLTDDNTDSGLVVRKCFRMVGGVLVERTVKDVLPALVSNRDKMGRSSNLRIWGTHVSLLGKLIESLDKQLADKERVAAALENSHLLTVVNQCLDVGASSE